MVTPRHTMRSCEDQSTFWANLSTKLKFDLTKENHYLESASSTIWMMMMMKPLHFSRQVKLAKMRHCKQLSSPQKPLKEVQHKFLASEQRESAFRIRTSDQFSSFSCPPIRRSVHSSDRFQLSTHWWVTLINSSFPSLYSAVIVTSSCSIGSLGTTLQSTTGSPRVKGSSMLSVVSCSSSSVSLLAA